MNTLLTFAVVLLPAVAVTAMLAFSFKGFAGGKSRKKILKTNVIAFALVLILCSALAFSVSAAGEQPADAQAQTEEQAAEDTSSYKGLGLLAAGLVTSLAGIGGGIAVAAGAPAAIAATSENPKNFGKSLIFVALGESIALYGVVISILILNKI